jgi:UDP-GlcNAc:undecaprenyl-phosphate GlcNAc-1-phosphate transferase
VLAVPLSDLILAIVRRLAKGKSPFTPDKEHLHHRLIRAGNSQQRTVVIMYFITATVAFPVTVLAFAQWWVAVLTALVMLGISILIVKKSKIKA